MLGHTEHLTEQFTPGEITDPISFVGDHYFHFGMSTVYDFVDGDNRPLWSTWTQHAIHRYQSRLIQQTLIMACNITENLENFVIGQGFTYRVKLRDGESNEFLRREVQRCVDRILRDNCFHEIDFSPAGMSGGTLESQIHHRSRCDGEDFLGIYSPRRGEIEFRLINAEHVVEPLGSTTDFEKRLGYRFAQNWKYGIHTGRHDQQNALGYAVQWDAEGLEVDYHPAMHWEQAVAFRTGLVHHIKRNVNTNVKRGLSDFFPTASDLVDDAKLIRNVRRGAQTQAAIAWIEQFQDQRKAAGSVTKELAHESATDPRQNLFREPGMSHHRKIGPGTVLVVGKGKEYKPGPMGADRNNGFALVAELSARRIASRWNMPEYMISSDASNNNYASILMAGGPFDRSRKKDQAFYSGHFRWILWKALSILCFQGYFRAYSIYTIKELVNRVGIDVDCPLISSQDTLKTAQAAEIMHDKGVLSKTSWQVQAELDPEQENANQSDEIPTGQGAGDAASGAGPATNVSATETPASATAPTLLNGAQITAADSLLSNVSAGKGSPKVATVLLTSLGFTPGSAEAMAKDAASYAASNPLSEEFGERLAKQIQKTFWEDLNTRSGSYP